MATDFSAAFLNTALSAADRLNGGKLRVLSATGTIGEMGFADPAFSAAVDGVRAANPMVSGNAVAGNAVKYQALNITGGVEFEGDVVAGDTAPPDALALLRLDFVGGEELKPLSFVITAG